MRHSLNNVFPSAGSPVGSWCVGVHSPMLSTHCSSAYSGGFSGSLTTHGGSRRVPQTTSGQRFGSVFGDYSHEVGLSGWKNDVGFHINAKETMQLLNDRLASYLEEVSCLEEENRDLERKIKAWYEKHTPQAAPDYGKYFSTIDELQTKIADANIENPSLVLLIDNARLAGEDLQIKYNMELSQRNTVDADVSSLRRGLDVFTLEKCDLERHFEDLKEEILHLKKNHEEEVTRLRAQLGARVNVEVNAAPAVNLNKVLTEIREEYEKLMERNINDVENWFISQSEELDSQVLHRTENLESMKSETIELRHTVQTLEIDLQTQLSTNCALQDTLTETETIYRSQLSQLQGFIDSIEDELGQFRWDLARQHHEYKILMDVKTRLEMEIATYQRLLEGEDIYVPSSHYSENKDSRSGLKIFSITEEFENGKIVSTCEQIHHIKR
ncbi:keratin, type I cytoskeletal 19-like [Pelobates fuscus]|uniref:keratin, type I cytoskeletal 19-like n=1 Tax=Pelobates fuscus TaxID=191477 RepID=UPI002FE4F8BC